MACQTPPKPYQTITEGEWQTKVLVKDLENAQSHILNVNLKAIKNQSLRMDVTNPAGMHIASLVLNNDEIEYVLIQEKKFIRGKASANALKPLIHIPMDPRLLQNLVFDSPIEIEGWNCQFDKIDYLQLCQNDKAKLKMEWGDREPSNKLVKILHPKVELQMKFLKFEPVISNREKSFSLKIPPQFKIYRLR